MKDLDPVIWAIGCLGAATFAAGAMLMVMIALAFGIRLWAMKRKRRH